MSEPSLHLLHLRPDARRLAAWAARHRLLEDQGDFGYALHGLLRAAFGDYAPQPFRYLGAEQGLLAYTSAHVATLRERAECAAQEVADALGLAAVAGHEGLSAKPFPTRWPHGHLLAFDARVRPVVRASKDGSERDAFLVAVEKAGESAVDRQDIYRQWLKEQFERGGGAELVGAVVTRWRLLDVMRQTRRDASTNKRVRRTVRGPDVEFRGRLRVADPDRFAALLTRGIGRHRSFGFGMLLLRPAQT
jgi:CRISPR system Cascade subunit CasE